MTTRCDGNQLEENDGTLEEIEEYGNFDSLKTICREMNIRLVIKLMHLYAL